MEQSLQGAAVDSAVFGTMNAASVAGAWQEAEQPFLHQSSDVMIGDMMEINSQYEFSGRNGMATGSSFLLNQRNEANLQTWRTNGIFLDMVDIVTLQFFTVLIMSCSSCETII